MGAIERADRGEACGTLTDSLKTGVRREWGWWSSESACERVDNDDILFVLKMW